MPKPSLRLSFLSWISACTLIVLFFAGTGFLLGYCIDMSTAMTSRYGVILPAAGALLALVCCVIEAIITHRHGMIFFTD